MLYVDEDKTIDFKISECRQLAKKEYKTRHDCVRKVIPGELCQKFKFNHSTKWYMHNAVSALVNETYGFLRDFEIQADHLISARRPHQVIVNKKDILPNR